MMQSSKPTKNMLSNMSNNINVEIEKSRYSFLKMDEKEKLKTLFCNYISLGHFELARSVLLLLSPHPPTGWAQR